MQQPTARSPCTTALISAPSNSEWFCRHKSPSLPPSFCPQLLHCLPAASFNAFRWSMMKPIGSAALAWTQAVVARDKMLLEVVLVHVGGDGVGRHLLRGAEAFSGAFAGQFGRGLQAIITPERATHPRRETAVQPTPARGTTSDAAELSSQLNDWLPQRRGLVAAPLPAAIIARACGLLGPPAGAGAWAHKHIQPDGIESRPPARAEPRFLLAQVPFIGVRRVRHAHRQPADRRRIYQQLAATASSTR